MQSMSPAHSVTKSIKKNIISNYIGGTWSALMGFVFVPLYIRYLGVESYGLIGIYVALQAWFVLLDMGLGQTLNREMARFRGGAHTEKSIRDLLRSMEVIYFLVSMVIAIGVFSGAGWLAGNWLKAKDLPEAAVVTVLAIMGVVIALRYLGGLYRSAILGLQEHMWLNVCNVVFSTLRGGGVLLVLIWISPTIQAFFIFQAIVSLVETIALGAMLYFLLPPSPVSGRFSWVEIASAWRFTGGVTLITLLVLLMTQVDKILLSTWLSLTEFGHYSLAGAVASVLYMLVNPIGSAVSPRFAELVAKGETASAGAAYHRYAQLLSISVVPVALVISAFPDHLLLLWTRDLLLTEAVAPIVTALCIGTLLNALMAIPYALQLAYGWTRLTIQASILVVVIYIPSLFVIVPYFGSLGAAWLWAMINAFFIVVVLPLMHRRLMPGELGVWYRKDVLPAFLASGVVVGGARLMVDMPDIASPYYSLLILIVCTIAAFSAAAFAMPAGRVTARSIINNLLHAIRPC